MNDVLRSLFDAVLSQFGVSLQRDERAAWQPPPAKPWQGLAPATLTQRGLALTAALLALVAEGGAATWLALAIALQVGGGLALMGLPRALGWSEAALFRIVPLAMVCGGLGVIVASQIKPPSTDLELQLRWAAAGFALLVVIVPPALTMLWPFAARLFGPMLLPAWTAATVFAGALLFLLGVTASSSLQTRDLRLSQLMALLLVGWIASFLVSRFEAGRGYRQTGRLLALRTWLARLGGLAFGLALAWRWVPLLDDAARRAAFATPLEGWAPLAGTCCAALMAAFVAAAGFALPGLLARRQLGGRLTAGAAGESAWLLALLAVISLTSLFLPLWEVLPFVFSLGWAVVAHAAVRVALGRPLDVSGIPLWLALPAATLSRNALALAELAGRNWPWGPVNLLAPPALAPIVRGTHLRLAQQAGALNSVFASAPADVASGSWGPPMGGRDGLPAREAYCAAPAARALFAGLPPEARVWVLSDGPRAAGWDEVLRQLPAGAGCLARDPQSVPAGGSGWEVMDFAQDGLRDSAWSAFLGKHQPRLPPQRRILVLHGPSDRSLADRLVYLLDGQTDAAGHSVVASTLAPIGVLNASDPIFLSVKTLASLVALAARSDKTGLLASLNRLAWRIFFGRDGAEAPVSPELVVVEDGFDEFAARMTRGMDRLAPAVLALLPAQRAIDRKLLFDNSAYSARLVLPPPSALGTMLPLVAQQILDEPRGGSMEIGNAAGGSEPEVPTADMLGSTRATPDVVNKSSGEAISESAVATPLATEAASEFSTEPQPAEGEVSPYGNLEHQVYISCAYREPSLAVARLLARRLSSSLSRVFPSPNMFSALDDAIPEAGGEARQGMDSALNEANHFLVMLDDDYLRSTRGLHELQVAARRHAASGEPRLLFIRIGPPHSLSGQQKADSRDDADPIGELTRLTGLANPEFLVLNEDKGHQVGLDWENRNRLTVQVAELAERFLRSLGARAETSLASSPLAAESPSVPVFLSYVSEYAIYREMLEDALLARGLEVRSDRGLAPGELWREALAKALAESRILVSLAGPATAASPFATAEIDTALQRGMPVVPVVVALFEVPQALRERQFANRRWLADLGPDELPEEIARAADAIAELAATLAQQDSSEFPQAPA